MEDNESFFVCLECVGDPMLRMSPAALKSERICAACTQPTRRGLSPKRIANFIGKHLQMGNCTALTRRLHFN